MPTSGSKALKLGWQVACLCLLGIFVPALVTSLGYSLTDALGPGPGFFPFWLSVGGGFLGLVLLVQAARGTLQFETQTLKFELRPVALVFAGLIVATALLEAVGFRLAMLALLPYLLLVLGVRNWFALAAFSLAGSFGVYHLFSGPLKVPLP